MTPEQMRARIAELEGQLSMVCRFADIPSDMLGPPTPEEIEEILHGPKAPPGEMERMIRDFAREVGIES